MLPATRRPNLPPMSQRMTPRQRAAVAASEHNPDRLYSRDQGLLELRHGQLRDLSGSRGLAKIPQGRSLGTPSGRSLGNGNLVRATGLGMQKNKMV